MNEELPSLRTPAEVGIQVGSDVFVLGILVPAPGEAFDSKRERTTFLREI